MNDKFRQQLQAQESCWNRSEKCTHELIRF